MIPRSLRVVYWALVGGIALLLLMLVYGCVQKQSRISAMRDESRIAAPTDQPAEQVSIAQANDADASILLDEVNLALPAEPALRARVILERMFSDFAQPASTHPLPGGKVVTEVFLLPLPLSNPADNSDDHAETQHASPYGHDHLADEQLAVVDLTKSFADAHPSGIEVEDLTLRAVVATIHADFPSVTEVRFLVDGQTRDTLAGHADLTRPYAVADPTNSIHVLSAFGNPM